MRIYNPIGVLFSCLIIIFGTPRWSWAQDQGDKRENINWYIEGKKAKVPGELENAVSKLQLTSDDSVKSEILKWYYAQGFLNARVDSLRLTTGHDENIYIHRGCSFTISQFNITSDDSTITREYEPGLENGDRYTTRVVDKEIDRLMEYFENLGYPLVTVQIETFDPVSEKCKVNIGLKVKPGDQKRVTGVIIPDLKRNDPDYIRKVTGIKDSSLITPQLIQTARRNLMNTGLFNEVGEPQIVVSDQKNYLEFDQLKERNPNIFDLIIGYVPEQGGGGTVVGNGRLKIRNIFWNGSTTRLEFKRLKKLVTRLNVGFERHWVMGIPLGYGINFRFLQQDTTYQIRNAQANASYTFNGTTEITGSLRREVSVAGNPAGLTVNVLDAKASFAGLGFRYHVLDAPVVPTRGIDLSISLETGIKNITDARANADSIDNRLMQRQLQFEVMPYIPVFKRQVVAPSIHGYFMDSGQYSESDLVRFGGARSLRGYREDQFMASRMVWGDMEYRYLIDPTTYAFVFGAIGTYHRPRLVTESRAKSAQTGWLHSWGLGFTYATRLGLLQFSYALSPEDPLSNGKVHFGIIADI